MEPEQKSSAHHIDPTANSNSLAIALVVSAALLLAAIGIVVWLFMTHAGAKTTAVSQPADDAVGVKNVSFIAAATLPATYVKNDQSKIGLTTIFYDDDATNCGFTASVVPIPANKTPKEVVTDALAAAQTQGVTPTKTADAAHLKLKDAASGKTYDFSAVDVDQKVDVPGVSYTSQHNTIAYKQFGTQVASLGYACKSETWDAKKAELGTIAATFTVKTER